MNKSIYLLLFLLVFGTDGVAQKASKQEKKILDISSNKFNWLIEKNYDSLELLLDDRLTYVHSSGWVQSKAEVIDDLKSGKLTYAKVTIKEAAARMYSKTAIVNGIATIDGLMEGKSFVVDLRYTEVYVLKGNDWVLVSRHANKMP